MIKTVEKDYFVILKDEIESYEYSGSSDPNVKLNQQEKAIWHA